MKQIRVDNLENEKKKEGNHSLTEKARKSVTSNGWATSVVLRNDEMQNSKRTTEIYKGKGATIIIMQGVSFFWVTITY